VREFLRAAHRHHATKLAELYRADASGQGRGWGAHLQISTTSVLGDDLLKCATGSALRAAIQQEPARVRSGKAQKLSGLETS
jgi:hypothetical protein